MQKTHERGRSRRSPGGYVVLEPGGGERKNREFKLGYSDLDPQVGEVRSEVRSPISGMVFYVYRAPLVYEKMIAFMIV